MPDQGFIGQQPTGQPDQSPFIQPNGVPNPQGQQPMQPYGTSSQQVPVQPTAQAPSTPWPPQQQQSAASQQVLPPQQVFYDPYGRPFYYDQAGTPVYYQPEAMIAAAPQPQGKSARSLKPLAIAAFVLGLVSLLLSITPLAPIALILGLVTVVLALIALVIPAAKPRKGKGFAITSIILGIIALFFSFTMANVLYGNSQAVSSSSSTSASSASSSASLSSSASGSFNAASYEAVPYEDVARDPDAYKNKKLVFSGSVVQVVEGSTNAIRLATDGSYSDIVLVQYRPSLVDKRLLEGDTIKVYGVCTGLYDYTSGFGKQVSIPGMNADKIELVTEEEKAQQAAAQYGVTIDSCSLTTNYSGESVVIVSVTFTNNSSETTSFSRALDMQVFQDGVELSEAYVGGNSAYDSSSKYKDVKSGGTISVQEAFTLNGSGSIAVEVKLHSTRKDGALVAEGTFSV